MFGLLQRQPEYNKLTRRRLKICREILTKQAIIHGDEGGINMVETCNEEIILTCLALQSELRR